MLPRFLRNWQIAGPPAHRRILKSSLQLRLGSHWMLDGQGYGSYPCSPVCDRNKDQMRRRKGQHLSSTHWGIDSHIFIHCPSFHYYTSAIPNKCTHFFMLTLFVKTFLMLYSWFSNKTVTRYYIGMYYFTIHFMLIRIYIVSWLFIVLYTVNYFPYNIFPLLFEPILVPFFKASV